MAAPTSTPCGCSSTCSSATAEPIVCTLAGAEQSTRVAEFKAAFAHLARTEPFDAGFRWHFQGDAGLEAVLRDLARREHDCCRFFEFHVARVDDAIVWEARADERGRRVLDELMRLPETLRAETDVNALERLMNVAGLRFASDAEQPVQAPVPPE